MVLHRSNNSLLYSHFWFNAPNGFGLVKQQEKNICLNFQKFHWIETPFPTLKFQQVL